VIKHARPDHPIHDLVVRRWSPYAFSSRDVSTEDLRSLFEAARWAPSSYNEQPWCFIVARRSEPAPFEQVLQCLVEGNREWARQAPVLALTVARERFKRNDKPNRAAEHDVGLAVASLSVEATARGISVHQMIGILPDRAAEAFQIPEGAHALTALAIGYPAGPDEPAADVLRTRDQTPRQRKPLGEFVFGETFGTTSAIVSGA